MSIEKDLKDNTAALKANTEILQKLYDLKVAKVSTDSPVVATAVPAAAIQEPALTPTPAAPAAPAAAPAAPATAPAPADVVPTAVVPPAPVAAPVTMKTPEEMNALLVSEFKRIGDRAPIDAAMATLGVVSVSDLDAVKQQELIIAVAAIPSAS